MLMKRMDLLLASPGSLRMVESHMVRGWDGMRMVESHMVRRWDGMRMVIGWVGIVHVERCWR